jgi:hypothetical protein
VISDLRPAIEDNQHGWVRPPASARMADAAQLQFVERKSATDWDEVLHPDKTLRFSLASTSTTSGK